MVRNAQAASSRFLGRTGKRRWLNDRDDEFSEIHANTFLVAESRQEAKQRAKADLLTGWKGRVHTDDIYEIDSCVELSKVGNFHIELTKTGGKENLKFNNGYHIIPEAVIEDYMRRTSRNPAPS
jgi:hypothetical protein